MDDAVARVGNSVVTARHYGYSPEVIIEEGSADPYADPYYKPKA